MSYLDKLLGKNENIMFSTRQHWTRFIVGSWFSIFLFALAIALAVVINTYTSSLSFGLNPTNQILLREGIVVLLLAYPVISILLRYFRWSAEQYVVTNLRVIHLSGILSKNVIDSSLEKVNDVMLQQSFLGRIFDYGDLEILTAAETGVNKFDYIAQPLAFKSAMLEAKQDLDRSARRETDEITGMIAKLAILREQGAITEQEFEVGKTRLLKEL